MKTPDLTNSIASVSVAPAKTLRVEFASEVLQQIRQHAGSSMQAEICGVLIGDSAEGITRVNARIPGEGAAQGGAHVTFTQDAWEHIFKIKDKDFPDASVVGWYHSHPGFGIFLSDYDLFIHGNFFNAPHQVAWVCDPHSNDEGCFGWLGTEVAPVKEVAVIRKESAAQSDAGLENSPSDREVSENPSLASSPTKKASSRSGLFDFMVVATVAFIIGFFMRPHIDDLVIKYTRSHPALPGAVIQH